MRAILLIGKLILIAFVCAQGQITHLQFFQQNRLLVNPAAVDREHILPEARNRNPNILQLATRQQWVGFDGAPKTYYVGFEHNPMVVPGDQIINFKWAGYVYRETIGNFQNIAAYANFAYSLKFSNTQNSRLYIGINAGLVNSFYSQLEEGSVKDLDDVVVNAISGENAAYADFGFGLFYQQDKSFYVGVSMPRLISPLKVSLNEDLASEYLVPQSELLTPIYLVMGGFLGASDYGSQEFVLEPSLWVRYTRNMLLYTNSSNGIPISADLNIRAYLQQKFWLGAGYSTNRHFSFDVGTDFSFSQTQLSCDRVRVSLGTMVPILASGLNFGPSVELNLAYLWN